jgi:hypothetical protein
MSFQILWSPETAAQFQELQQAAAAALRQGGHAIQACTSIPSPACAIPSIQR